MRRRDFLKRASVGTIAAGIGGPLGRSAGVAPGGQSEPRTAVRPSGRSSFSFLHSYEATGRYWRGLEKAGLIRPGTGVRLVNSPWGDDSRRFNNVARIGGELHKIIKQAGGPFIVDRVVGGSPYREYEFDAELIKAYVLLLGEKFLGGQVHETVCNARNDWGRFLKIDPTYAREPIKPDELRSYFDWSNSGRWLECGVLDDYAGRVFPSSMEAIWKETMRVAKPQAARFQSRYSYCEGSVHGELAWHAFYKHGAASCLAEVGVWASHNTQFMIASLRGAARAAGRPWGVFFAPWGPKACTSFIDLKDCSWQMPPFDSRHIPGPEKGPSSAFQRRSFFHAYLSGAHTLHEEWGAEDNLTDWDNGRLSSYGRVTRDLLDFQDAFPDVGRPFTPIALVLDSTVIPPVDFEKAASGGKTRRGRTPDGVVQGWFKPRPIDVAWSKMRLAMFSQGSEDAAKTSRKGSGGSEVRCYSPCVLPEIFDIVPSDAPDEVWSGYKEVIAVGEGHAPKCAKTYPVDSQFGRLADAVNRLSPLSRSTHMPMQINFRKSDGAWIVGLYNPWGARRGDVYNVGSILDESFTTRELIRPKFPFKTARAIHAWPGSSALKVTGNELYATVGPGGTLIIEVV